MENQELFERLQEIHGNHIVPLKIGKETPEVKEYCGTKEAMQGKQKVAGHYFSTIMLKPKDVRFYFFPIYTHADNYALSAPLQKMLKGKSCFHLKKVDDEILDEISEMIKTGVDLYQKDALI